MHIYTDLSSTEYGNLESHIRLHNTGVHSHVRGELIILFFKLVDWKCACKVHACFEEKDWLDVSDHLKYESL